jgi:hypothetical protein
LRLTHSLWNLGRAAGADTIAALVTERYLDFEPVHRAIRTGLLHTLTAGFRELLRTGPASGNLSPEQLKGAPENCTVENNTKWGGV